MNRNTPRRTSSKRMLITSGPTREPIDAVRYIGNRSSGRLGAVLAEAAAARDWSVAALVGHGAVVPVHPHVLVERFDSTQDLAALLDRRFPEADVLVMAAAVADFRPAEPQPDAKLRRTSSGLELRLEPTPDLLAACTKRRRPDQFVVGFALEPGENLEAAARAKLERKNVHMIVANPMETMDSPTIEAFVVGAPGTGFENGISTGGSVSKPAFASWLLGLIEQAAAACRTPPPRAGAGDG